MLPQQITFQHPPSSANSFPHTLFRTLCRRRKTQPLCNQANPNSLSKTPGVGYAPHDAPTSFALVSEPPCVSALSLPSICMSNVFKNLQNPFPATPLLAHLYKTPGVAEGTHPNFPGDQLSTVDWPYSEGPSGRKYCVPFTGSCRRRSSCCKSSLRSTKSISEVLITSRSEAAYRKKKCS